ncbi:MAG TPA: hypothetical protein VF229_00970, partial [Burkholderiaceae bacterium]
FAGVEIGHSLRFALRQWTVVGVFDAGGTGFDSEIWGDFDQLRQAFRRETYALQIGAAAAIGVVAALAPMLRAARIRIVDGLRHVG